MKIEISKKPNKNFYDEFLYVANNYKKIKKNPTKKITTMTKVLIKYICLVLILFVIELINYLEAKNDFHLFVLGFVFLLLLYSTIYLIAIQKRLQVFLKDYSKSSIDISESGVELIKENTQNVKVEWNSIDFILINQYSICLIPKNITNIMIALNTENKSNFLAGIKEYNKSGLVIDNMKLYNKGK